MRNFVSAALIGLSLLCAWPALAFRFGVASIGDNSCPYGTDTSDHDNGCSARDLNSTYIVPNWFSWIAQSGQTYVSATFTASINSSGVMTVTAVSNSGAHSTGMFAGNTVTYTGVPLGMIIAPFGTNGTTGTGLTGTYQLTNRNGIATGVVSSQTMNAWNRPDRNVAGVDFKIGARAAALNCIAGSSSCDPAYATLPATCSLQTLGSPSYTRVHCVPPAGTSPGALDIEGMNFSLNNCLPIYVDKNAAGYTYSPITIEGNLWGPGSNCDNYVKNGGGQYGYIYIYASAVTRSVDIGNNTMDSDWANYLGGVDYNANWAVYDVSIGPAGGGQCTKTYHHNVMNNLFNQAMEIGTSYCTAQAQYNYVQDTGRGGTIDFPSNPHGAFAQMGAGNYGTPADWVIVQGNTDSWSSWDTPYPPSNTTMFSLIAVSSTGTQEIGTNPGIPGGVVWKNNTNVINKTPGGVIMSGDALGENVHTTGIYSMSVTGNWLDATGSTDCQWSSREAYTGYVDNRAGGAGNTLTITAAPPKVVPPYWNKIFNDVPTNNANYHMVLPWASGQPSCDGAPATGTGGAGMYCLAGTAMTQASSGSPATMYLYTAPVVTPVVYSGNTMMVDHSAATMDYLNWNGQCYGHF